MLEMFISVSENGVIGRRKALPWTIESLRRRRWIHVTDKTVIVGRGTHDRSSVLLPFKEAVVITRRLNWTPRKRDERVWPAYDPIEYLKSASEDANERQIVIGGEKIYKLALPYCQELNISLIKENFSGDAFFPTSLYQNDFDLVDSYEKELFSRSNKVSPYVFDEKDLYSQSNKSSSYVFVEFQKWMRHGYKPMNITQ